MFGITEYKRNLINHLYNSFSKAIVEDDDSSYQSAVAIILKNGKVLMGRSNSKDERLGKYCFPGGRIDKGENVYKAAVREAKEEAGVVCENRGDKIVKDPGLKQVGFILCDYKSGKPTPNWEFEDMNWFDLKNLPKDILERNKKLIEKYLL